MLKIEAVKISRTLGLPAYGSFSSVKLIRTIIAIVVWAVATALVIKKISSPLKLGMFLVIYENWLSLLISMVCMGVLIGQNWLKYGELREIQFLTELPIARKSIAFWKVLSLTAELIGLLLLLIPALIPWGVNINWVGYGVQLLLILLLSIAGILMGILLDSLIYRLFASSVSKIVSYLFALTLFSVTIFKPFALALTTAEAGIASGGLLALIVLEIYLVSWAILPRFDSIDSMHSKAIKSKRNSSWGNFALAVARKDIVHYWREAGQLLQLLVISVVLILILSQVSSMGPMVTRVMLLGIPYSFAGVITLHLAGSDGVIMTLIKHCKGSLQGYYGVRSLFSCLFVLLLSVLAYTVLALCFYRQGLGLSYYGALIFVCLISVALASGISVVFKKGAPNPLLPLRGISALGEVIYWIMGIGPVLQLAMWMPIPSALSQVPTGFNILATIALGASIVIWTLGIYRVDTPN